MSRKILLLIGISIGLLSFIVGSYSLADEIKAVSRISQVTIYPGSALVTREAQIDLPSGTHTVIFDNIVPEINENTLTVKGQGTAEVKIFGASIKSEYLTHSADDRVKDLTAQIESLDDDITGQQNKQGLLQKQQEYLDSVKLFTNQQIPKDLVTKIPTVTELDQLGIFLDKSFTDISTQNEGIRLKLRDLNRKKEALNRQLQELNINTQNVKRSIAIDLESVQPGSLTLMVSYLVNNVDWRPLYDARVMFDKNQVDLALFGLVSQSSGEDWEDVHLTISTVRPSIGGVMPELSSWTLSPYQPPVYANDKVMFGKLRSASDDIGDQLKGELSEAYGGSPINGAPVAVLPPRKAKMVYAQSEQKGISVVYKISKLINIKSDGSQQRVPIQSLTLPTQFEYATTPKLSNFAYLRSQVENNQDATLLPGRVNIFLDGDYVGGSSIVKAIGHKEKFDLYMGADEGVSVKRELIEEKSDDTLFANIPSMNKVVRYSYKITVENYKTKAITLNLFDNLPVSQDQKIKIKDVKVNPEPTQKDYKDRKGVMLWTVSLNPQEKKDFSYSFAIERPRDLNIEGL